MPASPKLLKWLRDACAKYEHDVEALYRRRGTNAWPLSATNDAQLVKKLGDGGHFLPLPKEPAALANILEVAIVDYLVGRLRSTSGAAAQRGKERFYPDVEISGSHFGGGFHAVDVKIAMRKRSKRGSKPPTQTQSRITLYTGNTYFAYPEMKWDGTFRPFAEYKSHVDVVGIYTLNAESTSRVDDLELIVQEPWTIASKKRSSTTREYIGAVMDIQALREGRGEFKTEDEFYKYWRRYKFKVGDSVKSKLQRLLKKT